MTSRPVIFISAVSRELHSARQLVAEILRKAGVEIAMHDIATEPPADLRPELRAKIDGSQGLVQLVGSQYGFEPPAFDAPLDPQSYTHFEARHALERKLPVWFIVLDDKFHRDTTEPEPPEKAVLQSAWRVRIRKLGHRCEDIATREDLAICALRIAHEAGGAMSRPEAEPVIDVQATYAEAEQELRARIATDLRDFGPEHAETLRSRNDLGAALSAQGKLDEAEQEYRAVLAIRERVLDREHPEVFGSCYHLALALARQKKYPEALKLARRAEEGWRTALYDQHPKFKLARALREKLDHES